MSPFPDPSDPLGQRVPGGAADAGGAAPDGRPRPARDGPTPPIIADDGAAGDGIAAAEDPEDAPAPDGGPAFGASAWRLAGRGRRLERPAAPPAPPLTGEQRLLVLDAWRRSGLPAGDFAPLVNLSRHTLYEWKRRFEAEGPAGLQDKPRGSPRGSRLPEATKRAILMMKQDNPDWGCERISALLLRGPALPASPQAVARVLHEAGYETEEAPTRPHAPPVHHFERARPNQLWQTDLFTFVLKRQNRRVYLVAFLDDHSRFPRTWPQPSAASSADGPRPRLSCRGLVRRCRRHAPPRSSRRGDRLPRRRGPRRRLPRPPPFVHHAAAARRRSPEAGAGTGPAFGHSPDDERLHPRPAARPGRRDRRAAVPPAGGPARRGRGDRNDGRAREQRCTPALPCR